MLNARRHAYADIWDHVIKNLDFLPECRRALFLCQCFGEATLEALHSQFGFP
jgi:hypothetical protein